MDRRLGRPLPHQLPNPTRADPKAINLCLPNIAKEEGHTVLAVVSNCCSVPKGTFPRVTHPSAANLKTEVPQFARLACVRPAASVRSEPGSNSQVESTEPPVARKPKALSLTRLNRSHIVIMPQTTTPKDHGKRHVKLTTTIIGAEAPRWPISEQSVRRNETKPPAYPFVHITCQRAASALETSQEAIGGGTHARAPPPVSAVYMEILPGAQAAFQAF